MRKRKCGDTSTALSACFTAFSKLSPRFVACSNKGRSESISTFSTGRRNARPANNSMFFRAAEDLLFNKPGRSTKKLGGAAAKTSPAAAKNFSSRMGGTNSVSALLSKPPPPPPSAGNLSAG